MVLAWNRLSRLTDMSDRNVQLISLWQSFIEGDKDAYSLLYRQYHPRLYNYGRKFTSDLVLIEDNIQDIFVKFWIGKEKLHKIESFHSYLFVSFRHALVKSIQQQEAERSKIINEENISFNLEISIDQVIIDREQLSEQHLLLTNALKNLSERQKEAIFFLFYENLSYKEVAEILNISTKATYKLVARALSELRSNYLSRSMVSLLLFSI